MTEAAVPGFVVPGQIISPIIEKKEGVFRKFKPGIGAKFTETSNGVKVITATLLGQVHVTPEQDQQSSSAKSNSVHYKVTVQNKASNSYENFDGRKSSSVLPEVGDVVLCRITRLASRQAHAEILVVENKGAINADSGLGINGSASGVANVYAAMSGQSASGATATSADVGEGFGGIIRIQDVRATERDKVKIPSCFKPGDIVRASVISLGDGTNYYLSTAANDYGVVFAKSAAGQHMHPVNWQTMKCSITGVEEERKCAKPF